jgi:hypothetical protein
MAKPPRARASGKRRPSGSAAIVPEPPEPLAGAALATAAAGSATGALALALYLYTLAPTVGLVDSGELVVAAHALGVAHPPGFPLWVLLGHLAALVPWGNVAERVNGLSACSAALAAAVLVASAREASLHNAPPRRTASGVTGDVRAGARWRFADLVPPVLAGLLLLASRTLWSYATVAEVYALNTLLVALILGLLFRWRRAPGEDRPLLFAAAIFGLALGVHHVTVALLLPALALLVFRCAGFAFFRGRRLLRAAGLSFAAFVTVNLYLPWAAARGAGLNWGDPRDLERVVSHLTGRQYQSFFTPTAASLRAELADWAALLARNFGPTFLPLTLALALFGFAALWKRDRTLFSVLTAAVTVNTLFGLLYTIAEDKDAYYLPTIVVLALAAAAGARALLAATPARARALVAGALLCLPLLSGAAAWPASNRRDDRVAESFVADSLAGVAEGGLVLTGEWQLYSPLLYYREVENLRPDVVTIDTKLLRRSWYFAFLERRAGGLLAATRGEVDLYLEELRRWEADRAPYDLDPALTQRINRRFYSMILALVARGLERGPVYVSRDIALAAFASDEPLPPMLGERYGLVPKGLLFELRNDRGFVEPGAPPPVAARPSIRALFDPSRPIDPANVAAGKVRSIYLTMIVSRGLYLAGHGRAGEARDALRGALALDPNFEPARQALASLGGS